LGFYEITGIFQKPTWDLPFLLIAHTDALTRSCLLHPPIPCALEVQHCARMPEEAAGSIAAILQLPKPSAPQRKTLCREQRPALLLPYLTASLFHTRPTQCKEEGG